MNHAYLNRQRSKPPREQIDFIYFYFIKTINDQIKNYEDAKKAFKQYQTNANYLRIKLVN